MKKARSVVAKRRGACVSNIVRCCRIETAENGVNPLPGGTPRRPGIGLAGFVAGGEHMSDIAKRAAALGAAAGLVVLPFTAILLVIAGFFALRPREPWQP